MSLYLYTQNFISMKARNYQDWELTGGEEDDDGEARRRLERGLSVRENGLILGTGRSLRVIGRVFMSLAIGPLYYMVRYGPAHSLLVTSFRYFLLSSFKLYYFQTKLMFQKSKTFFQIIKQIIFKNKFELYPLFHEYTTRKLNIVGLNIVKLI